MEVNFVVSNVFSVLSLVCYSVVYLPQMWLIYKTKSSQGISILMLLFWTQADCLSLMGSIIVGLQWNLIVLGWYHFLVGVVMIVMAMWYQSNTSRMIVVTIVFVLANVLTCVLLMVLLPQPDLFWGDIIGWVATVVYVVGRFPQLILNHKTKSTEGLSVWMYILTMAGNMSYLLSIVVYSQEPYYIRTNLPWIILTVLLFFLDVVVLVQIAMYKKQAEQLEAGAFTTE
ncbi:MAG: PQ-loop repeat-containing protein [Proteobacteria bacterium]|nr:PQ-loop repeat-containing protein [Pseudomonadota bacterium]NBP15099.1 PQ-loop repeat-containing protein [bacterium]